MFDWSELKDRILQFTLSLTLTSARRLTGVLVRSRRAVEVGLAILSADVSLA